jgi:peptidoglycan hydrolase-like protein with peptidoglycan-binding domain
MSGGATYSYRTSPGGEETAVQLALRRHGYYRGPIDGDIGPASQRAIRSFQADNGLPVTGTVNRSLLQALRVGV